MACCNICGTAILGSLLFNIFIADLFIIHSDIDLADDNKLYFSAKNIERSSSSSKRNCPHFRASVALLLHF